MNRPRGWGVVVAALLGAVCGGSAAQAQPCVPAWSSPFGWNGVSDINWPEGWYGVIAAVTAEGGDGVSRRPVYLGGHFGIAGSVGANCAARWDGAGSWSALSPVVTDIGHEVRAMAIFDPGDGSGPGVYAGGIFTGGLKRSNGSGWLAVPGSGGIHVQAMLVYDDGTGPAMYLARSNRETVSPNNGVYRWDGQAWSQLGRGQAGLPAEMRCLAFFDDDGPGPNPTALYAGGLAGVGGSAVARWDGATWTPLGMGDGASVQALEAFDADGDGPGLPQLYAGGLFTEDHGAPSDNLVRWDGSQWQPVGAGTSGRVRALRSFDVGDGSGRSLYIGGDFDTVSGVASRGIARYDGESFSAVGGGVLGGHAGSLGVVHALVPYDDGVGGAPMLLVLGRFGSAGPIRSSGVVCWTASGWRAAGTGPPFVHTSGAAAANGPPQTPVAVTGRPANAPSTHQMLALWDGATWELAGGEINGAVNVLRWLDLEDGRGPVLYAGGDFSSINGAPVGRIARFEDGVWTPLESGIGGPEDTTVRVDAIAAWRTAATGQKQLIVAGAFATAGGQPASNIASWDGEAWSPLGPGVSGRVRALATMEGVSGDDLYAGGSFLGTGGIAVSRVMKWDGESWSAIGLGGGVPTNSVFALAVDDRTSPSPTLYAGGNYYINSNLFQIARWDGTQWFRVGPPPLAPLTLAVYDADGTGPQMPGLYAGGPTSISAAVYFWNGVGWQITANNLFSTGNLNPVRALTELEPHSLGSGLLLDGALVLINGARVAGFALYGGCPRCPADYNSDGAANSSDISSFLEGWLAAVTGGPVDADFNRDRATNSSDISAFLTAWLDAVTNGC